MSKISHLVFDTMGIIMHCLQLLLVPVIFAMPEEITVDNYHVIIENGFLESVEATAASTDYLNLSDRHLYHIEEGAFKNTEIRTLLLADNKLDELPCFAFRSLHKLEHLSLANNMLHDLQCVFGGLKNLKVLDIRNNGITQLDKGAFYGLTNTTKIIAHGNDFGKISSEHFENPFTLLSFCIADGIVKSLEVFDENSDMQYTDECTIKIRPLIGHSVELNGEDIIGFEKGWYRIHGPIVKSLNLRGNGITSITKEMLNDLPEELTEVDLAVNEIKHLLYGVIVNRNLRKLDLSGNYITYIDRDAFANTENLEILLYDNEFSISTLTRNFKDVLKIVNVADTNIPEHYIVNPK